MKTVKELLNMMLNNQHLFHNGLCGWALTLYHYDIISKEEHQLISKYILKNRPSIFSSLYCFKVQFRSGYFWKAGDIAPRIKWIKKHIKRNS
jgi:hypothetical protein